MAESDTPASLDRADELFHAGRFRAAGRLYAHIVATDPDKVHALAQHGYTALLANQLTMAKSLLKRALLLDPRHPRARANLANALWREDAYEELTALLPLPGLDGPTATAAQLRSFDGRRPYEISGPPVARIPFTSIDPLPLVELSLNGAKPELFFLDTGALFALNEDYAAELGVPTYGHTAGRTMYGEHPFHQGRVDLLTLGEMRIRHLPVHTIPDEIRIPAPDGRVTKGAIGTSVLARFLSTIDYRDEVLILRRDQAHLPGAVGTPMYLLGDHYLLSHGTVNGLDPMVFFVDTGGGDIGFTAPPSTFAAAGSRVPPEDGLHPVTIEEVTLGPVTRHDLPGLIGAFPEWFEEGFGFRIGGLPTHQFFKPYAVTFDFERMRIHFGTREEPDDVIIPSSRTAPASSGRSPRG